MKDAIVQEIFALLESKMGSGEKKIRYEDAVLVDEAEKTIFLYETTTEKSEGFSFGTNGVVINYDFDLGDIPKSIKAIAEKNGFKFMTVIGRKSAESH